MKLLAIETSLDACSAALDLDGEVLERHEIAPRRHVERLLPMIRALLDEAHLALTDLDGIAFGAGPGSFTGVRIAVSAAQGLGLGAGLGLVGVSSLAALGAEALAGGAERVFVVQDARMGEFYVAALARDERGGHKTLLEDSLLPPEAIRLDDAGNWSLAGAGAGRLRRHAGVLPSPMADTGLRFPRAAFVASLARPCFSAGRAVTPESAQAAYLRQEVARPPS